ncbi:DUF1285 domain-containing protein [Paraferrimonas sp. SM1919]|uniref:DUF1285 domain-containing protein n=1 Tax=Paraferrimonas sp. SM1919 TaxID=2662263 RepID=UPI0013D2B9C1|nr:DUF1285 domain-containing protein [Paraferrimonas sp. SM1919]
MDLTELSKQLDNNEHVRASWQPKTCGNIDIRIDTNGDWYHQGVKITRLPLVRLFAGVLRFEQGQYYLVTAVEKMQIQVDDVPFYISDLIFNEEQFIGQTTVGLSYRGNIEDIDFDGEQLSFTLWQNCKAKLTRAEHLRVSEKAVIEGDKLIYNLPATPLKFTLK